MIWAKLNFLSDTPDTMPQMLLPSHRLYLRPPQHKDWLEWANIRRANQDFLKPFEPTWNKACFEEDYFDRRLISQTKNWFNDKAYAFLIFKDNDEMIGGININHVCRGAAQYASLGYWLDKNHQGQGFMQEALQSILKFGFDELNLHRFNAACLKNNERSIKMLKKAKFKEEGIAHKYLKINGIWQDHILFGLNIEDWEVPIAI